MEEYKKRIVDDILELKLEAFKMVLTGVGQIAYRRTDNVLVVPIGTLKP